MSDSVEALHRFGLKLFVRPGTELDCRHVIPVFHSWIQTSALDVLLIDVADYTHLVDGPSVLLVGYELNLSLDTAEGRLGLLCTQKRRGSGSFAERLTGLARTLLTAGQLLESEPALDGRLRFLGCELQFVSNDRMIAPPGENAVAALTSALNSLATTLYPDQPCDLTSPPPSGDRLKVTLKVNEPVLLETLLPRVSQVSSIK